MASDVVGEEIVYVSWGGTGRAATLRKAMDSAQRSDRGLVYLAVLDDSTFGDIERSMLDLAKDELSWLLDVQLDLTRRQTGFADLPVRVLVRSGDVVEEVVEVVDAIDGKQVLIGAPVPASAEQEVTELLAVLSARMGADVNLIEP